MYGAEHQTTNMIVKALPHNKTIFNYLFNHTVYFICFVVNKSKSKKKNLKIIYHHVLKSDNYIILDN